MQKACLFALLGIVLPSIGAGQDVLRSDQYGDELPLGALQRFGSVRFRQPMGCDAVAVSPDGKLLASGSRFYVRMWDLASGERILQDRMGCTALAFSHDGRLLACGGDDGKFKLWDVKRGVEVFSATHPASPGQHRVISEIAFWPDDLVFATAGGDNDVRVWDTTTGRNLLAFRHGGEEASTLRIAIAPDGRYLASSKGAEIRVWDAQEGGDPVVISAAHPRGVAALAFSSDSGTLISSGRRRAWRSGGTALSPRFATGLWRSTSTPTKWNIPFPSVPRFRTGTVMLWRWTARARCAPSAATIPANRSS